MNDDPIERKISAADSRLSVSRPSTAITETLGSAAALKKLTSTVTSLQTELDTVKAENATLKAQILELEANAQAAEKTSAAQLERSAGTHSTLITKYEKLLSSEQAVVAAKTAEIDRLQTQIKELTANSSNADAVTAKELVTLRATCSELELRHRSRLTELAEVSAELETRQRDLNLTKQELASQKELVRTMQKQQAEFQRENTSLRSKFAASYTAGELSEYLNSTIDSFNETVNEADAAVNYVVNGLDMDLKTHVYKDEGSQGLRFSPADLASNSAESLSSIKISIRAVPR